MLLSSGYSWIPTAALLVLLVGPAVAQQCYDPDGSRVTNADWNVPCDRSSNVTHCCGSSDECYTNGLCKARQDGGINWFWRHGCTDQTWGSPSCPNYCTSQYPDGPALVHQCGPTTFCCHIASDETLYIVSNFTCCDQPDQVFEALEPVHLAGPSVYQDEIWLQSETQTPSGPTSDEVWTTIAERSSSSTPASTPASETNSAAVASVTNPSSSPSSSAPAPAPSDTSSGPSLSVKVGVGVGVGVPLVALLFAGVAFLFYRRHRKRAASSAAPNPHAGYAHPPGHAYHGYPTPPQSGVTTHYYAKHGAPAPPMLHEIHGNQMYEMPTGRESKLGGGAVYQHPVPK